MDQELYDMLQRSRAGHERMVRAVTDEALNGSELDWVVIGEAMDLLGNRKLARQTDLEEARGK